MFEATRYIHTEDTRNQYRESKYNSDHREAFDHLVLVVGNNAGKCIEGAAQYVCIDIRHFQSLWIVNDEVVQKFFFFFCQTKEISSFDFCQQQLIGA